MRRIFALDDTYNVMGPGRDKTGLEPAGGDHLLAKRMLRGDAAAFQEFLDRVLPATERFARSRLRGRSEHVEDVVQSTMLKALESLGRYRGESTLTTWVLGICNFQIMALFRHLGARQSVDIVEETPEIRNALLALERTEPDPQVLAERQEAARSVHLALDRLPVHYAQALEWKYEEHASVREIASRLTLSEKATESLLTRARTAFRKVFTTPVQTLKEENR